MVVMYNLKHFELAIALYIKNFVAYNANVILYFFVKIYK